MDVIVSFKSNSTVSFCTKIEFHAERSLVVCFVTVYAAADNNLLTTHAYLTSSDYNHEIIYKNEISMPVTNSVIEYETEEDDNNNKRNSLYFQRRVIFKLHYTLHFNAKFLSNVLSSICTC